MPIVCRNWPRSSMPELQGVTRGDTLAACTSIRLLGDLGQTDPAMKDCEPQVREAAIHLGLSGRLRDYVSDLDADPARQTVVEDRLDLVKRLKAKYGGSVEAVMETALRARQELQALEHHGAHVRRDQAPRGCRTCRDRPERAIDEKAPGSCEAAYDARHQNWRLSGWNRPPSRSSSPRKRRLSRIPGQRVVTGSSFAGQ